MAKSHHAQSEQELHEARDYLRGVEKRWGVVDLLDQSDLESDDEENDESVELQKEIVGGRRENGGVNGQRRRQQRQAVVDGDEQEQQTSTLSPSIAAGSATAAAQSIEITSSGEPLVNGIYQHHSTTTTSNSNSTTSNSSSSSIYIHSSGPFHIHQQEYDICIFPKVYGDKFRWCIGLVPCTAVQNDGNDNDDDNQEEYTQHQQQQQQQQIDKNNNNRTRDYNLAFIYYWTTDIPLHTSSTTLSMVQLWGACHGERPLPNVSFGGKRWWQFWKN